MYLFIFSKEFVLTLLKTHTQMYYSLCNTVNAELYGSEHKFLLCNTKVFQSHSASLYKSLHTFLQHKYAMRWNKNKITENY